MKSHWKIIVIAAILVDIVAWASILMPTFGKRLEMYFFAVGQGDSELIVMPGNVKLLIDGGPNNGKVAQQLDAVVPWHDRYIDMVLLSHADLDHFGGLIDLLERYEVGVFIYNGEGSDSESFKELKSVIKEQNINVTILEAGDAITYGDNTVDILSAHGKNKNESAIVARFAGGGTSALFMGDVGKGTELRLAKEKDLNSDILKVAHHGSKNSSMGEFLKAVSPKIAVIEVGKNSYGHPADSVIERMQRLGARVFRTDSDGMVRLVVEGGSIDQYISGPRGVQ